MVRRVLWVERDQIEAYLDFEIRNGGIILESRRAGSASVEPWTGFPSGAHRRSGRGGDEDMVETVMSVEEHYPSGFG